MPVPLTESTERLYRLLELTSDGICEIDVEGRCTYCNSMAAHLLGFESAELVGSLLHEMIHPGGRYLVPSECSICQAVKNAREVLFDESTHRTLGTFSNKAGSAIPVSYSISPNIVDGLYRGAAILFSDNAEQRRLVGELRERAAELAESERRKTEFIAILAHELRNPLAPLRSALQLMREAADGATSMTHLREMMERQLGQLVRLMNDLLDVALLGSGQMTLQKEQVALQEMLKAALEASEPSRTAHRLTLELPAESIYLYADGARLTQAFTSILNNAAQYSAAGSPIILRAEGGESVARIEISDAGVGIAREALTRIFDMFTRAPRDLKTPRSGLGVGLSLARRIVRMHGGEIIASSEGRGKGSHFLISLPLATSQVKVNLEAVAQHSVPTLKPLRALIVDDNIDAAVSLSLLLQLGGHTTALAHDGFEALKSATEFKPDVVLLDLGLPGVDGYEVARVIRRTAGTENAFLVAVTGWGSSEDRLRTKQAGFDEHLTKPVDIATIELILGSRAARLSATGDGEQAVEKGGAVDIPR